MTDTSHGPNSSNEAKPVRKRGKTFTGCFTCRSRKIRCDLLKPFCKNCTKARLFCGGYDIKLRWSSPIKFNSKTGNAITSLVKFNTKNGKPDEEDSGEYFQRRNVDFVVWDSKKNCGPYMLYDEMDRDLGELSVLSVALDALGGQKTKLAGPFGVFQKNPTANTPKRKSPSKQESSRKLPRIESDADVSLAANFDSNTAHDQLWLSNELRDDALLTAAALNGDTQFLEFMSTFASNLPSSVPPENDANNNNDFLNLVFHKNTANLSNIPDEQMYKKNENLEIQLHASNNQQDEENTDIVEGDHGHLTTMPEAIMKIVQSPLEPKLGFDVSLSASTGLPTTALEVEPLARYLLNHYLTQVADLMTVIPLTENPWKTIYFPKALMAIGELSALGKTSVAKSALLNALLAVSAFNLQSKFAKNSDPMKYYLNLGIRLRNQASLFIRQLLGSNNDTQSGIERCLSTEKYKDVLCAVMTMISVDLVWGTMQDTNFYIKWCERVISTKMENKKKLSSKARILHRIFSSLKLIQDSTCLDLNNIKDTHEYDVNGDKFDKLKPSFKNTFDYILNSLGARTKDTSPRFVDKKLINIKKNDENFATDALYGLPNSLIVLFSEIVQLLRIKLYRQETNQNLPPDFQKRLDTVDSSLSNWVLDWKLYDEGAEKHFHTPMHEATYHHILSFYHALTIYFKRFIQDIPATEVQDKVEKTLDHLNLIQKLIAKDEAAIIPLFWQGFIAGCEALSLQLQMGFKKWGADIAQYLGSYWGARQIMLEVWRRKRMKESRDDWVSVIQDWEMNLMLN